MSKARGTSPLGKSVEYFLHMYMTDIYIYARFVMSEAHLFQTEYKAQMCEAHGTSPLGE